MTECEVFLRVSNEDWETMVSILRGWHKDEKLIVDVDEVAEFEELSKSNNERFVRIYLHISRISEMFEKFKDKIEYRLQTVIMC